MSKESLIDKESDDEIDLRKLFGILWLDRIKIIITTTVFAVASVFYALSVPNQYKITVLLAPAQSSGDGLSNALGQFSGFASFAGVSLARGQSSESEIAQEIMKSRYFIEKFIVENDLAIAVYAADGWNKESNELEIIEDVYDLKNKQWLIEDSSNNVGPPTNWQLFKKFKKMLSISEDSESGLVSVSIEYYSPLVAKEWLDLYVDAINEHMQARQVAKVSNNVSYLEDQIDKTSITEMKEVFYTIIEEQIKKKMVAEASPDYAFLEVSPSMVPEERSKPNRAVICILGTMLGATLSVFFVLLRNYVISFVKNH